MTESAPPDTPSGYQVGDITIDLVRRQVISKGREIELGKLSYRLLVVLAESAPRVVAPDELAERVWEGRFVSPATLKQRITLLRQALGENANQPELIKAVRGHGYTLIPEVKSVYGPADTRRARPLARAAAITAVVVAGISGMLYFDAITPNRPLSIAVLPFENLSPAPGDAYFASGLHQEVLDRLSLVSGLQVISRNAVQRFAGSPTAIADTAREYRADAVLEGTVKYQDDRVSISIHLVDPKSGVQTWSSTYEREFSDILDIQQDIARSVAGTLGVTLGVAGGETKDIDAYRAYLAGLDMLGKPRGEDRASSFFRRATDLDPGFAAAWTQLGFATVIRAYFAQPEDARGILEDARSILVRATDLDPQSARAAATLGFVRYSLLDWIGAEEDFARAIDTQANAYTLNQHAGMLVRAGRISAAKSEFDAATSADPSNSQPGQLRRHISVVEQDYSEARDLVAMDEVAGRRQQLLLAIALSEGQPDVIRNAMTELIAVQGEAGPMLVPLMRELESPERALAIIRDAYANGDLQWPSKQYNIALFAAYFGDPELALAAVSADVRMTTVRLWILWYPLMSDVRLLPGFKDLVRALGLPSYWRAYGWPDACAPLGEGDFRCW